MKKYNEKFFIYKDINDHDIKYIKIFQKIYKKFIILLEDELLKITKKKPILSTDGGTSDGRFIAKCNSQIIELGLTNKTIHKVNEYVKISHLKKLTLIYEDIMKHLFI